MQSEMELLKRRKKRTRVIVLFVSMTIFVWFIMTIYAGEQGTVENIAIEQRYDTKMERTTVSFTRPRPPSVTEQALQRVPLIYVITPTVYRHEQKADLTRLSHTLRLVPRIHWIVVEDRQKRSKRIAAFLSRSRVEYTHLTTETDLLDIAILKLKGKLKSGWEVPKGIQQRNLALEWITEHGEFPSVIYAADDDNAYDLRLFEEMRYTKTVSVWPVGLIGNAMFQTPVVKNGKVIDWAAGWIANRTFAIDMAGFAVNSEVLKRPNPPRFSLEAGKGNIETNFLEQLNVKLSELEPMADNCTKVLVWHTRTEKSSMIFNNVLQSRLRDFTLKFLEV